jgi:hypothetical protein
LIKNITWSFPGILPQRSLEEKVEMKKEGTDCLKNLYQQHLLVGEEVEGG